MNEVRSWLRQHDPLAEDRGLDPDEVRRMRGLVVAAERKLSSGAAPPPLLSAPARAAWGVAAAAAVALLAWTSARIGPADETGSVPQWPAVEHFQPPFASGEPAARHQLQFETRGGTRIIWVFDTSREAEGGGR
jgi:hypothetical protein